MWDQERKDAVIGNDPEVDQRTPPGLLSESMNGERLLMNRLAKGRNAVGVRWATRGIRSLRRDCQGGSPRSGIGWDLADDGEAGWLLNWKDVPQIPPHHHSQLDHLATWLAPFLARCEDRRTARTLNEIVGGILGSDCLVCAWIAAFFPLLANGAHADRQLRRFVHGETTPDPETLLANL